MSSGLQKGRAHDFLVKKMLSKPVEPKIVKKAPHTTTLVGLLGGVETSIDSENIDANSYEKIAYKINGEYSFLSPGFNYTFGKGKEKETYSIVMQENGLIRLKRRIRKTLRTLSFSAML